MKRVVFLVLLQFTCLLTYAQGNHGIDSVRSFLKFKINKITDQLTAVGKDTISGVTTEGYQFYIVPCYDTRDNYYAISFFCKDAGCVNNRALVDYTFADGKKKVGWHYGSNNCDGVFMVVYKSWVGIEPREILPFTTKLLSTISLSGSKIIEIGLNKQQAALLRSQIKWLKYYADDWRKINKLNGYD